MELTSLQRATTFLKKIGNIKFWISTVTTSITCAVIGYLVSDVMVYGGFWEKYKNLNDFVKSLISIENWWIEALLGGCIPMFIAFGVQFFLLNTNQKDKDLIFSALPFIPILNWLAIKPVIFMFGTSSAFLGAILFLGIEGDARYLIGLVIPITLYGASLTLRYQSSQIMAGKGFSDFTYKNHKIIGWSCFSMSLACWLYADIYAPSKELALLWLQLK